MPTENDPKNSLDHIMPKAYSSADWEDTLYQKWEESGYFRPEQSIEDKLISDDAPIFSMVLPPPNVTGHLHVGHATMLAIQDILTRFHRMRGYRTLWLPGTDHAAIATQSRVEKLLHETTGKTRHNFEREEFLKHVTDFAQKSHDTIINQTKKMGSSLDWSREAYTLDKQRNQSVCYAFKQMYDDGIIYRSYRTVNWSVKGQSTCSDDEVVYVERPAKLYTFYYNETFRDLGIAIATTRPETKLGDVAVAIHPNDPRYKEHVGTTIEVGSFADNSNGPNLFIRIIADDMVDPSFGTGAVGITPTHSHIDYDFFIRHKDEFGDLYARQIIGINGKITEFAGLAYSGLNTEEAREKIIRNLKERGLFIKEEDITQSVGTSDRYGDIIEVLPLEQWFIGVNHEFTARDGQKTTLKKLMQEAVTSGKTTILPERFTKTYFHWIDNLRDWCISRQIWYGHRIPVWYRESEVFCGTEAPTGEGWEQDPDTLDTWFSSGLWTFSTLGWGHNEAQWEREKIYHPTTVLETGYDILFFWVARMILMSTYFLGEVPFKNAYLHGLVRDEQGRKMSKSLGNVIDPLDIIPEYGADALRLALIIGSTPGNDIKIGVEKIKSSRNFTNKLWNIGRYVLTQSKTAETSPSPQSAADHWVLSRLQETIAKTTEHLEKYNFSLAGETLRDFTWSDFADWYVEIHKIEKNDAVLRFVFETLLRLWHPFMPFVTEALFQSFHSNTDTLLMVASWPSSEAVSSNLEQKNSFAHTIELITAIRNIRSTYRIEPAQKITVSIFAQETAFLESQRDIISRLARIENLTLSSKETIYPSDAARIGVADILAFVHLEGILDTTKETERLNKERSDLENYLARIEARLASPQFTEQAPEHVVAGAREEQKKIQDKLAQVNEALNLLK